MYELGPVQEASENHISVYERVGQFMTDLVSMIAPAAALRMDYARGLRKTLDLSARGYDAARPTRFNKNILTTNGGPNEELILQDSLCKLRQFTREQIRNSPIAKAAQKALEAHLIGTGFNLQARATDPKGNPLDTFNKDIERLWNIWTEQCDSMGRKDFNEFLSQMGRSLPVDGEYIIHKVHKKRRGDLMDFKIESIEPDLLDESLINPVNNNRTIGGIELDNFGEPLFYNFFKIRRNEILGFERRQGGHERIPARDIIHAFRENRPGQVRGEPWFAPALIFIQTAHRSVEAELYTLEIQACLSVLYKTNTGGTKRWLGSEAANKKNAAGDRIRKLAPGSIIEIPDADDIKVVDPSRPGNTFAPFIDKVIGIIGASLDISFNKITKDYSNGSFSGLRMGEQDDRRHLQPIQRWLSRSVIKPIYAEFVTQAVMNGLVTAPMFFENKAFYLQADFTPQPWAFIDPLKDAMADKAKVASGFKNLKDIAAEAGKDWREMLKQNALEIQFAKDAGADVERIKGQKSSQVQTAGAMRQ